MRIAGDPAPEAEPETGDAFDILVFEQQNRMLRDALAVLTAEERQAIEAAYFSGLTYLEVSKRLNQPLGTVKTRIRSGLQKLRRALAGARKP